MKQFILQLNINDTWATVTNSLNITPASSYEEILQKGANHTASLSFSIMKHVFMNGKDQENLFAEKMVPSSRLRLWEYNAQDFEVTDFIITSVQPIIHNTTIEYKINATDVASTQYPKIAKGLEIELLNKTIIEMAEEVIANSELANTLKVQISNPNKSFKSIVDGELVRASLILSSSNLYNALVEIALLFNANIYFAYEDTQYTKNTIVFTDLSILEFKGYRLNESTNMTSFTVTDTNQNFTTAMQIYGGEEVTMPPIPPMQVEQFFASQVDFTKRDIDDTEFNDFNTWYPGSYIDLYNDNKISIPSFSTQEETDKAISDVKRFLTICDLIPAYNNVLYNFDYFVNQKMLLPNAAKSLYIMLFDKLRKYNIKISLASKIIGRYNIILSSYKSEIEDYSGYLMSESTYFNEAATEGNLRGQERSSEELTKYLGYLEKMYTVSPTNDFHDSVVNIYGYETDNYETGFHYLIAQVDEKILETKETVAELEKMIANINVQLSSSITESVRMSLEADKKGYTNRMNELKEFYNTQTLFFTEYSENLFDNYLLAEGIGYLNIMKQFYRAALMSYRASSSSSIPSLHELLFVDKPNSPNLITARKTLLNKIYDTFGIFIIETEYSNQDEVSSSGLIDQAYLTMYGTSEVDMHNPDGSLTEKNLEFLKRYYGYRTPDRTFGINFIELSALEDYSFLTLKVGDKIGLTSKQIGLQDNLISVASITYNLRDLGKSQLTVQKISETENILQKLLALI